MINAILGLLRAAYASLLLVSIRCRARGLAGLLLVGLGWAGTPAIAGVGVGFPAPLPVGTVSAPVPVAITLRRSGTVGAVKVVTQGVAGLDFNGDGTGTCAAGQSYAAGQTCTVGVTFKPVYPGQRMGAVVVVDALGVAMGTQAISGVGTGAISTFIPGTMSTVAGNAAWLYGGDGGQATSSPIFLPFGISIDSQGNMYIADASNNRIRKVTASTGTMSTVAGNGVVGGTGDGGAATSASLSNPVSVAVDGTGDVYFTDNGNNVVRRVSALDGTISTVAGTMGQHGYTGDGGAAAGALLNTPNGIAFDGAGNLYIADTSNHVIRRVSVGTGVITTVAGTGSAGFGGDGGPATAALLNGPWGVTLAPGGTLYVADQYNHRIRAVSVTGVITTVAGNGQSGFDGDGGLATDATLDIPAGVAMDVVGNLYIADSGNNRVRKVSSRGGLITTVAGDNSESISGDGGPATQAGLYGPYSLALDGMGSLYIADVFHNRIRKVATNEARLDFPPMRVARTSAPQQQLVENDGNSLMTVTGVAAVHDAAVDAGTTTCVTGMVLKPLDVCAIGAQFAPTVLGTPTKGAIQVSSDAANAPGTLTLTGNVLSVDPATVTLQSNLNPAQAGATITFTAVVSSDGTVPTGTVTLLDGTTALATATLQTGGVATFSITTLTGGNHNITASYAGDKNNTAAVSATLVQVVKDVTATTTTSLAASANPTNAGAPVKLTAVISTTTAGAGAGAIGGTVTYKEGGTVLGTGTVSGGVATLTLTTLGVGTHSIVANYSGATGYGGSNSAVLVLQVKLAVNTASLTTSANPSVGNAAITLTATLTSNGGVPTGTVQFLEGATLLGAGTLNAQGVAVSTLRVGALAVGTHPLTAHYTGDVNNGPSDGSLQQVVSLASSVTVLSSSANPAAQGAGVVLTAHVTASGGSATGLVQFFDGATALGSGTLDAGGNASVTTAGLGLGSHTITASYGGDTFATGSSSTALQQTVDHAVATIALTASASSAPYGTAVTFKVQVQGTGTQPAGTVTLQDGATALGAATLDANGLAVITLSNVSIGGHTIVAVYGGDTYHAGVSSTGVGLQVLQVTTTAMVSSAGNAIAGAAVRLTVQVTGASGQATPGTVQVKDGGVVIATLPLDGAGTANYSTATLTPGAHTLTAVYSGDALNEPSTSLPLLQTETIATTATALTSSANPAYTRAAVTLTAAVSGNGGVPTGTVTFLDGTSSLGAVAVNASGTASLTLSALAPGFHTLTAAYAGDTLNGASVSPLLNEQIVQRTAVALTTSANPAYLGAPLIVTATVAGGLVATPASGTVTLTDGGSVIGTAALTLVGTATFTLNGPALGTHTFVASYAGDANSSPAASAPLVEQVTLWPSANTFNSSSSALSAGQSVTFVAVLTGGAPRPPQGVVTFVSGTTVVGTATLNASGVATLAFTPAQGNYDVVAQFAGDALYAASSSAKQTIVVGPTIEFTMNMTPADIAMASGDHKTLAITIVSAPTFSDTLALGCAGLPSYATCTFSTNQIAVSGGTKMLTVVVDTGNPLGSGPVARLDRSSSLSPGVLACMLPGGGLLALLLWRARRQSVRLGALLALALMVSAMATGCASSFSMKTTPAGAYSFRVVGTGNRTGATQSGNVSLTVTK